MLAFQYWLPWIKGPIGLMKHVVYHLPPLYQLLQPAHQWGTVEREFLKQDHPLSSRRLMLSFPILRTSRKRSRQPNKTSEVLSTILSSTVSASTSAQNSRQRRCEKSSPVTFQSSATSVIPVLATSGKSSRQSTRLSTRVSTGAEVGKAPTTC